MRNRFIIITLLVTSIAQLTLAATAADLNQRMIEKKNALIGSPAGAVLSKTARTNLVSYQNADFAMQYAAPAGWSFAAPDISTGVRVSIVATNAAYTPSVNLNVWKLSSNYEAVLFAKASCFETADVASGSTTDMYPSIIWTLDSAYSPGVNNAWIKIHGGTGNSVALVEFTYVDGVFCYEMWYVTSTADETANGSAVYFQHFLNLDTYSAAAAKSAAVPGMIRRSADRKAYDLLGRIHLSETPSAPGMIGVHGERDGLFKRTVEMPR